MAKRMKFAWKAAMRMGPRPAPLAGQVSAERALKYGSFSLPRQHG
jgi:hypothetical protein